MQISGHGKADHLAKLLLGAQETDGVGTKQAAARKESGRDQVHISEQAKELQRIRALTTEPDEARREHIDRIRQSLDGGTYQVSGRRVGDALLTHVLTDAVI